MKKICKRAFFCGSESDRVNLYCIVRVVWFFLYLFCSHLFSFLSTYLDRCIFIQIKKNIFMSTGSWEQNGSAIFISHENDLFLRSNISILNLLKYKIVRLVLCWRISLLMLMNNN